MKFSFYLIFLLGLLSACQTTRRHQREEVPQTPSLAPVEEVATKTPELERKPKSLGLILGPGGIRTYAHIGFLEVVSKAKIQIQAISGIEMGALVAALYAQKQQVYDVEWQMFKLNEKDWLRRGFLNQELQAGNIEDWNEHLDDFFSKSGMPLEKLPFSCPSYNLLRSEVVQMSKGDWKASLPYCLTAYPYFAPYRSSIAALNEMDSMAQFLRAKGAQQIVYVDVLTPQQGEVFFKPAESFANVFWTHVSKSIVNNKKAVDKFISVPANEAMDDFTARRTLLQKGREAGRVFVERFLTEQGY